MSAHINTHRQLLNMILSRDRKIKQLEREHMEREGQWAHERTQLRREILKIVREGETKEQNAIQRERQLKRQIAELIECVPFQTVDFTILTHRPGRSTKGE